MTGMREDRPDPGQTDPWPTLEAAVGEATVVAEHARAFYGSSLRSVWLYGSRARQDNRPDSDLDVLLVRDAPPGVDPTEDTTDLYDTSFRDVLEAEMGDFQLWPWPIQLRSARPEQLDAWDTMFFRSIREDAIQVL